MYTSIRCTQRIVRVYMHMIQPLINEQKNNKNIIVRTSQEMVEHGRRNWMCCARLLFAASVARLFRLGFTLWQPIQINIDETHDSNQCKYWTRWIRSISSHLVWLWNCFWCLLLWYDSRAMRTVYGAVSIHPVRPIWMRKTKKFCKILAQHYYVCAQQQAYYESDVEQVIVGVVACNQYLNAPCMWLYFLFDRFSVLAHSVLRVSFYVWVSVFCSSFA